MKPILSIVVPTLNEVKTIEKTLRAFTDHLTAYPYEVIVADDGSTDGTQAIAEKFARIAQRPEELPRGIARGKNRGASGARGEYLVFVDADVVVPNPDAFFGVALGRFMGDPTIVALTVKLRVFPEEATLADRLCFGFVNLTHWFNNNVTHTGSGSGEFQMIRASIFHELGGYREHLAVAEDNEMFVRLAKRGRAFFERLLTGYHTGRRAHQIGWPRLLLEWFLNAFFVKFFNRSYHKEWSQVR